VSIKTAKTTYRKKIIAFQGELGAFSHAAALATFPNDNPLPCVTFEQTIAAVQDENADFAIVPVENSLYGRITDIHHILPQSGLYIIGEHFLPIGMNLLGLPGAKLSDIKSVQSLSVALGQCRKFISDNKLRAINAVDTAGSAREIAQIGDISRAAIASSIAAQIYGLDIVEKNIEDASHNTTRFLIMSREKSQPKPDGNNIKTTFIFRVRNVPAALYKALGGFATNSVNMLKLESYMIDGSFTATQFYADINGHPNDKNVQLAFEELGFFTDQFSILGVYTAAKK